MVESQPNGIISNRGLSLENLAAIEQLAALCNQHDQITLKLYTFLLRDRPTDETNDFLYLQDGKVIGYLGIYQFNNQEIEISGMVHPDYRRQGIFTALLKRALEEIKQRQIRKLVFIAQQKSTSGRAFLDALGAKYSFSEHWMRMTESQLPPLRDPLSIRPVTVEDWPTVAHMVAVCFQSNETDAFDSIQKSHKDPRISRRLIEVNGEAVGTIAMTYGEENDAFIYGFCILPEFQGRGYGRQALSLLIQEALADGRSPIELEVAGRNDTALNLYKSCGFKVLTANDYYVQMIE